MTAEAHDNLETRLAELTQWKGGATALWRQAHGARKTAGRFRRLRWDWGTAWRPSYLALASIALGAVFLVAAIVNVPNLFTLSTDASRSFLSGASSVDTAKRDQNLRGVGHSFTIGTSSEPGSAFPGNQSLGSSRSNDAAWESLAGNTPSQFVSPSTVGSDSVDYAYQSQTPPPFDRQVIRRATIELRSDDVRAVFLKIQHVMRPEDGEYVESSALSGTERDSQANLTLRVASNRLSDVLNELRQIAEVVSESSSGEDVTAQVVDVESRLRNERRVEEEILDLLQKRENADLKDILDMRRRLAEVRQQIESLTGQRAQLDKLVSLATVLVIIRAKDTPQPRQGTLSAYFGESISAAWRGGLLFLADTLATMMRILIGGAFFWVILAGGIWAISRHRRRRARGSDSD